MKDQIELSPEEQERQLRYIELLTSLEDAVNAEYALEEERRQDERDKLKEAGVPVKDYDAASEDYVLETKRQEKLAKARKTTEEIVGGPLDQNTSLYRLLENKK